MSSPNASADAKGTTGRNGEWEVLMLAALGGDGRAYDRLLRAALPLLRAIARRRISDPAEAEDAVQDTLLSLHRLRHSWDPARPLRPWLATICERRCIDRLRQAHRQRARHVAIEDVPEGLLASGGHAASFDHLLQQEIRKAVDQLSPIQQLALRLTRLQGLSTAEAAAVSGHSVGGLKIAAHRAVRVLRARLAVAPA